MRIRSNLIMVLVWLILLTIITENIILCLDIKLKGERYLQGEITSYDDTGFELKRWDSGGIIKLQWVHLSAEETKRIKKLLNIESTQDKSVVTGRRIYLRNGSIHQGVVLQEDLNSISLRTLGETVKINKQNVLKSEASIINLFEVYTPEEIYQEKAEQFDLSKAEDNYELAIYCVETLGLLDKARKLLGEAYKLDQSYGTKTQQKIVVIENLIMNQYQEEIEQALQTGRFRTAKEILGKLKSEEFASAKETARIIRDIENKIIEAEQEGAEIFEKEAKSKIIPKWYKLLDENLRQISRNRKVNYQDAREYVTAILSQKINEKIAQELDMAEDDIEKIWRSRKLDDSNQETASYGKGSWIVADPPQAPSPDNVDEFVKFKEQMRQLAKAKRTAAKKKLLINADTWWEKATSAQKYNFLEAYFAEHLMKGVEIKSKPCPECKGEGFHLRKEPELCNRCYGKTVEIFVTYH